MTSRVTVVVVNWNGGNLLPECYDSIRAQTFRNWDLIVVDNASTDGSQEFLGNRSDVRLIQNNTNRGFGPANNQAFTEASGDYFAIVNNDVVLDPSWLERMVQAIEADPKIGMCAGKTLNYYDRNRIDNTGHLLYWDGTNRGRGRLQLDQGQFDGARTVFFPSGAAALFRASMIREIGGFDEDFFLYGDDAELGIRARLAGWDCAFVPDATAYHRYSASSAPYHSLKFFYVERNRLWIVWKYFPLELVLLNPLFSGLRYAFHLAALVAGKGVSGEFARRSNPLALFAIWARAQLSAWSGLLRCWRKRRAFFRRCPSVRSRFYQCFRPNRLSLRELTFVP
jgi:GT2 family glycosyltransferase